MFDRITSPSLRRHLAKQKCSPGSHICDVCLKNAMFDMATTDYGYATNDYKMRCDLNMVEYHVMNMVEYG